MTPAEWMAPLMFGGLVIFMVLGYPVAFSLAALGLCFGFASIEVGLIEPAYLGNLPFRIFGILSNELLLAIPFFTFMGTILERCGLAEDLLEATGQLFGLCGHSGWRHSGRHHRNSGCLRNCHGRHFPAHHDALRL